MKIIEDAKPARKVILGFLKWFKITNNEAFNLLGVNWGNNGAQLSYHSIPLEGRAKVYCTCLRHALLYMCVAETWALTKRLEGLLASYDHLRNKTCFPCLHSLVKTEANVWENLRADQWKPEMQSRVFTCSRILTNFAKVFNRLWRHGQHVLFLL